MTSPSTLASEAQPLPPVLVAPLSVPEQSDHTKAIQQLLEGETKWDQRLIHCSNWLNPILVKETRQALKSRQFSWTLMLLTLVVLAWSALGIVGMIPSIYYASNGTGLLIGYAIILIVPALIVIPQATFRSMASELEDGTFETLSLSTLSPRHIIVGKLSVAAVQLTVYLSVIAPCITLTYLLRGVTLEVIAMSILIIASCGLGLSAIAISVAAFARTRIQQVFFSIVLLVGQVVAAWITGMVVIGVVGYGTAAGEGWIAFGIFLVGMILYGWLFLRCGASAIGVTSENRSTPIRVPLLTIGILMCMFEALMMISFGAQNDLQSMIGVGLNFLFFHWGVAGCLMMGEQGIIPIRARRSLPSSLLGRLFLTWMNPGAGPGYVFVLLSFAGSAFTLVLAPWALLSSVQHNIGPGLLVYAIALTCFLALYLGLTRLICMLCMRRMMVGRLVASLAITLVSLILAVVLTCSLSLASNRYRDLSFDWYCFPNLFWTLVELFPTSKTALVDPEHLYALVALLLCALVVGFINVALAAKDVVLLRIETPDRVLAERKRGRVREEN